MTANLAAIFSAVPESERTSRLREFRMAAHLLLGRAHPVTQALADAIADSSAVPAAVAEIDALAAIPKRQLLAALASVLPA